MGNNTIIMRVKKFIPQRQYGFLSSDDEDKREIFFHLFSFKGYSDSDSIPPIAGEYVHVELMEGELENESSTKAIAVFRIEDPSYLVGVVSRFNELKGYGFIESDNGCVFYLHRSEIRSNEIPKVGDRVSFYTSSLDKGTRACHIKIVR